MRYTAEQLIAFEKDIADEYAAGRIHAPIHLEGGNEAQLLEIFKEIKPQDWLFVSWRSHLKCLLKGVPPEELKSEIMAGHSISLQFPKYRIYSSAIVGGILPIAVGVALAIKRDGGSEKVWCFIGDMTARTGIFEECLQYSQGFDLPIQFVIESNGLSVKTSTSEAWGGMGWPEVFEDIEVSHRFVRAYKYQSRWPHSGTGVRIDF